MADTMFKVVYPDTKAHNNGDGATYSLSVDKVTVPGGGTDIVFEFMDQVPLKAVDLGDGTYAIAVARQAI